MVSPEFLRFYPFFAFLSHEELRRMAMITEEIEVPSGEVIFHSGEEADALYLLVDGAVDLHYVVADEINSFRRRDYLVGTVNPGEVIGISAVVEPYQLTSTAVAAADSRLLRVDGTALLDLSEEHPDLGYGLQRMVARVALERLHATQILLAAATPPNSEPVAPG
jgi:NTE family protein